MSEMVKFASQVDGEVLGKIRDIAKAEGRHLQMLIDEALRDFLDKKTRERPRPEVLAAHRASIAELHEVYRHLAK
jgi:predicted transcriptional regulator